MAWFLLSNSAVRVQLSRAYRKVDTITVSISLALEDKAREMLLSRHIGFSLERATAVWAMLESISGLNPSFEMTHPGNVKPLS